MHCLWLPLYYTGRAELLWWRPCGTQKYLLTNPLLKRFADPALTETATHFFAFSTKFSLIVSSRINQPSGIPCLISSSSCQLSPSSSPLSFSSSCFSSLLCRKRLTQWDWAGQTLQISQKRLVFRTALHYEVWVLGRLCPMRWFSDAWGLGPHSTSLSR